MASAEERRGGGKTRSGLQLLAGGFAERFERGMLHEVGPADAECLELRAIDSAFDPLVDGLPGHRGVDVPARLFNAVVPARSIRVSVGLAGTAGSEARKRIAEVHGCKAYHSALQRAMPFGAILEAFRLLSGGKSGLNVADVFGSSGDGDGAPDGDVREDRGPATTARRASAGRRPDAGAGRTRKQAAGARVAPGMPFVRRDRPAARECSRRLSFDRCRCSMLTSAKDSLLRSAGAVRLSVAQC